MTSCKGYEQSGTIPYSLTDIAGYPTKRTSALQFKPLWKGLIEERKGQKVKQKQQSKDWLDSGLSRHRKNDLIGAVNCYQQALKVKPNAPDAQHYLGLAMYQLGQQAMGLHMMRQSLSALPDDAGMHLNYVKALQAVDAQSALQHLRELAARMPDDPDVALSCAEALRAQSRFDEAVSVLERLHALAPPSARSLHLLAMLHYQADRLPEALHSHRQAVQLDPALARQSRIGYALPAAQASKARLICAERDLYVIDDCVDDAAAYRAQVLASDFKQAQYAGQNYPGLQTDGMDCQPVMDRIAAALGRPIKAISPDNGACRLSFANSTARTDIHVDNETEESRRFYAGVLYLNPPEQCQGGTSFWKHLPTGWERRPSQEELQAAGYANFKVFQKRWLPNHRVLPFDALKEQREQNGTWKAVLEVPMRQNRLIIYRGDYFHSITGLFGTTLEDARLVQLFFFETLGDTDGQSIIEKTAK